MYFFEGKMYRIGAGVAAFGKWAAGACLHMHLLNTFWEQCAVYTTDICSYN